MPALALWALGSPKVHIQGNLSTGFKENRQARKGCPAHPFTCQDWDQHPLTLDHFLLIELVWMRAMCRSAWCNQVPLWTPQALLTPRWGALPHLYKDVYGEQTPLGPPSGLWEPCCSCGLRAGILANMVLKASVQVS